ncbi:hypothetical protein Pyn_10895 [Prunus yedoensis var. nudiflora]|uniref:Uncharacterized protein n=1 Tax=Prunus yedoensis var. nudiflora TaxID=2094558 RepID=A0A314YQW5_PRUYE|nr:hypothetical protein Pyn_10895 [Prunus yedoensis var. nudiflora]
MQAVAPPAPAVHCISIQPHHLISNTWFQILCMEYQLHKHQEPQQGRDPLLPGSSVVLLTLASVSFVVSVPVFTFVK